MSFSADVKTELLRQCGRARHCQIAELAGILYMQGTVDAAPLSIRLAAGSEELREKYALLLQMAFGLDASEPVSAGDTYRVLGTLKLLDAGGQAPTGDLAGRCADEQLLARDCCKRAYLRGAFLATGSISDPDKSYHLEIVSRSEEQARQMQELMQEFGMAGKIAQRRNQYVVYLIEGEQIVDMLGVMEAPVSLMNLENLRILREMRGSVNRRVNCETANIGKTVGAAVRQVEDIRRIRDTVGFEALTPPLREMAEARLAQPEATLQELADSMDPPISKSAANHRLRRLSQIAENFNIVSG